jgi:hypothetical protein
LRFRECLEKIGTPILRGERFAATVPWKGGGCKNVKERDKKNLFKKYLRKK